MSFDTEMGARLNSNHTLSSRAAILSALPYGLGITVIVSRLKKVQHVGMKGLSK